MNIFNKIGAWLQKQWSIFQLKRQIRKLQKQLNKIYQDLGKDYVDTHKNDPDDINHELIEQAVTLQKAIDEKNASIDEMRGIVRCVACGERIPQDAMFCPYCGMRQPDPEVKVVRYCPHCGTKLEVDEVFCHHCGTRIPQDDAPTEEITLRKPVKEQEKPVPVEKTQSIVIPESVKKEQEEKEKLKS
jgi:ribosomal protein S26